VVLLSSYNDPECTEKQKTAGAEQTVHKENLLDLKKIIYKKQKGIFFSS